MNAFVFQLTVTLVDVNDNAPTFTLSQYIVDNIPETVGVGSPILQGECLTPKKTVSFQ